MVLCANKKYKLTGLEYWSSYLMSSVCAFFTRSHMIDLYNSNGDRYVSWIKHKDDKLYAYTYPHMFKEIHELYKDGSIYFPFDILQRRSTLLEVMSSVRYWEYRNKELYLEQILKYGYPSSKYSNNVILPLIRSCMPAIIANQILGVQPMTSVTSDIFLIGSITAKGSNITTASTTLTP